MRRLVSILTLLPFLLAACNFAALSREERVARRAQARWDALIRGDIETAYAYLAPGYRKIKSLERYRRGIHGVGKWREARVERVTCPEKDVCNVDMQVKVRLMVPRMGEPIESVNPVRERWIYKAGEWWYVPES
ncbi:hypothetical protein MIT9_P0234 [Methylomarinovum caldicuralii]|uniref:Lipoprotein n=1 Tax=Methylomarinovum caldicuralii TaxID=438856 RepID=A0AAU9CCJ0_9GAMM|nr:hypothetical protein [Methylomarinovum caldicuralii]BCX80660.1 hypothetical protein MIT9_P0234 [Methylomarinovum caldicuralii]